MGRQRRSLKVADLLGDDGEMLGERGDLGLAFAVVLHPEQRAGVRIKRPFDRHDERGPTTVTEEDQAVVQSRDVNKLHSQS